MAQIFLELPDGTKYGVDRLYEPLTKIIKAEQTKQLLGRDDILLTVECSAPLNLPLGTKLVFGGEVYTLNVMPKDEKTGNRMYSYDLLFEAGYYDLTRAPFLDVDATGYYRSAEFDVMGDLSFFAHMICNAANLQFGAGSWIVGSVADSETKDLAFNNVSVLGALQQICAEFKIEFEVEYLPAGTKRLSIKKIGSLKSVPFEYGYGYGATKITRTSVNDTRVINRVYPYGSSENLPYGYRNHSNRLRIGNPGFDFIDNVESIEAIGVHAASQNFDSIKPERIGTVTGLVEGGLGFIDDQMPFDLNEKVGEDTKYLVPGKAAKITFQTGGLAGRQYDLKSYDHTTKKFEIIEVKDENGLATPSIEPFVIHTGDKYIMSDISFPESYVADAEARLRTEGQKFLDDNDSIMVAYGVEIDPEYIEGFIGDTETSLFFPGDTVPIKDIELDIDKTIRITALTRNVLDPREYSLELADSHDINYIKRNVIDRREIETIKRIYDLRNPMRAKMNWRTNQELLSMVFDTEGQYYSDKIKPLSIETTMLSVGAKSQQFILNLVMEPNYAGNYNSVKVNAGRLVHYTIEPTIRTWEISEQAVGLSDDNAYYIYARCLKSGDTGTILFSTEQLTVNADGQYYHFLLGVLHSPDPLLFVRWINLTYGATTINGRFIKTGMIMSANGEVFFDLDSGIIGGRITFRAADGSDKLVADFYQEQRDFADLVTESLGAMDGLVETWYYPNPPSLTNLPANQWTTIPLKDDHLNDLYFDTVAGKSYRFVKQAGVYSWEIISDQDITNALELASKALDAADSKRRVFVVQPFPPYDVGDLWKKGSDLMICINSKASGSYAASDWDLATNYDNTQVVIDAGVITGGRIQLVGEDGQIKAGITGGGTDDNAIRFWAGATYANRNVAPFRVSQGGEVFARKRIEMMSASNVGQAGICGANTAGDGEIRFWAGTNYENRATAPFQVLANGNIIATAGRIGNWAISGGGLVNDAGTAYLIMRSTTATKRSEVMIGTNVFPATTGSKSIALFRVTEDNTIGDNYAAVFYAMNATNGFYNWALYAFDGISFLGQTLLNGKKNFVANLANQFATLDPTMYDMISVYPTSGSCYVEFLAEASRRFIIGEGKEIVIINRNDSFSNFYLKNIVIGFPEFYLLGGKVVTIIYSQGNWYVKSERDNDW